MNGQIRTGHTKSDQFWQVGGQRGGIGVRRRCTIPFFEELREEEDCTGIYREGGGGRRRRGGRRCWLFTRRRNPVVEGRSQGGRLGRGHSRRASRGRRGGEEGEGGGPPREIAFLRGERRRRCLFASVSFQTGRRVDEALGRSLSLHHNVAIVG